MSEKKENIWLGFVVAMAWILFVRRLNAFLSPTLSMERKPFNLPHSVYCASDN